MRLTISLARALALVLALLVGPVHACMTCTGAGQSPKAASGVGNVAFDAAASASVATNPATTLSWTHTPVGTPTAVGVGIMNYNAGAAISSVKYGASTMALQTSQNDGTNATVYIYGLANPPSGAQTVTITFASTNSFTVGCSITVTGSSTSTAFSFSNTAAGNSTAPSVTTSSNAGEVVMDIVSVENNGTTNPGGSQTSRCGLNAGGLRGAGSTLPASGASTAMSWTLGTSGIWAQAAASFHK